MKREEAAKKLYEDLASRTEDANMQTLFKNLAQEEAGHKYYFEKLWDEEVLIYN
jgi:rubrerythrin